MAISLIIGPSAAAQWPIPEPLPITKTQMLQAAEQGNTWAQFRLGMMYVNGRGVMQNPTEAAKWLRLAAEQGHAETQFGLGVMSINGSGMPQNDTEAVTWFQKAAEQGHTEAQHNLGVVYAKGEGVPQNETEAAKWFRKAAERGHLGAQGIMGRRYFEGRGVPEDWVKAYSWFSLAGIQDEAAREARDLLRKILTPVQIAEAQELVAELSERISSEKQQEGEH